VDRRNCGTGISLRRVFIAKGAEAYDDAVESAELVRRVTDKLVVRGEIDCVESSRESRDAGANAYVLRHSLSLASVACGEV